MKFAFVILIIFLAQTIFGKYLLINTDDRADKTGSDYLTDEEDAGYNYDAIELTYRRPSE